MTAQIERMFRVTFDSLLSCYYESLCFWDKLIIIVISSQAKTNSVTLILGHIGKFYLLIWIRRDTCISLLLASYCFYFLDSPVLSLLNENSVCLNIALPEKIFLVSHNKVALLIVCQYTFLWFSFVLHTLTAISMVSMRCCSAVFLTFIS